MDMTLLWIIVMVIRVSQLIRIFVKQIKLIKSFGSLEMHLSPLQGATVLLK